MPITILELAKYRGVKADEDNSINMGEFWRVGLDMIGGCSHCEATIAAYNAYPSKSGYWMCEDHIGDRGYDTVEEANREIFDGKMPEEEQDE